MDDFALTPAERALFHALNQREVPFLVIGMGAAVLEGAPIATQDLDVWFARLDDNRLALAAADAGGFWISGFGMQPPAFGGEGLSRIDVVLTAHGLDGFETESAPPERPRATAGARGDARGAARIREVALRPRPVSRAASPRAL